MDRLAKTSFVAVCQGHKKAFLRPNAIYFLPHLAVGALMTGAAVPTPLIIESANKTVKICGKYKIVHSKHCLIDKFSSNCKKESGKFFVHLIQYS